MYLFSRISIFSKSKKTFCNDLFNWFLWVMCAETVRYEIHRIIDNVNRFWPQSSINLNTVWILSVFFHSNLVLQMKLKWKEYHRRNVFHFYHWNFFSMWTKIHWEYTINHQKWNWSISMHTVESKYLVWFWHTSERILRTSGWKLSTGQH